MKTTYERHIHQFLSVYRFLAFALAVLLTQVVPGGMPNVPDLQTYVILGSLGAYSLFKVFSPLRWWQKDPVTYAVLGGDLVICLVLLLYTGGLSSGLLLYSLAPLVTAALLFEERISVSVAALFPISLTIGHIGFSQITNRLGWVMENNYLPWLIIYSIVCFLIGAMPYRINLNILRRVESNAVLEERRRIRREIHDGVAQTLTYLNLKTRQVTNSVASQQVERAISDLVEIQAMVQDAYEDIRESIDQLGMKTRSFPLVPALAGYVREFGEKTRILARFEAPRDGFQLSPVVELQLMRIAQEALTNVRKHSQASEVWVTLDSTARETQMVIKDDGQGFTLPNPQGDSTKPHGLSMMRERAESLGGTLDIITAPGEGTEIRVRVPGEKVRL